MKVFPAPSSAAVALLCLGFTACVSQAERVAEKEDMLAAAGFTVRPATTRERQVALRALPPHQFVQRERGDRVVYLFADPLVCNCLYIGDQQAYGRYQRMVFERELVDARLLTAQLRRDAAWDWGPWGPGWW